MRSASFFILGLIFGLGFALIITRQVRNASVLPNSDHQVSDRSGKQVIVPAGRYELALDEYPEGVLKLQHSSPGLELISGSTGYGKVENDDLSLEYASSEKPNPESAFLLYLTLKKSGEVIEIVLPTAP